MTNNNANHHLVGFYRSSHRKRSLRKGVLRNFAKFTGKHLCQRLFFNQVADLSLQLYKKGTLTQVFSCEFSEISKNTFFTEHLWPTASGPIRLNAAFCVFDKFHYLQRCHKTLAPNF